MTMGVFLPNWVGDVVMATPTLRALRRHVGPRGRLIGIGNGASASVLEGTRWLDEMWRYDSTGTTPRLHALAVAMRLRWVGIDSAVLLVNSRRSARIAWLGGARDRVGYVRGNGRERYLTRALDPPMRDGRLLPTSTLDYYLALAGAMGCPAEPPSLELATTAADETAAGAAWRRLGLGHDVVAMHAGGSYGPAKHWPEEYFADLASRVAGDLDREVLFLCGPGEQDRAERIVARVGRKGVTSLAALPPSLGLAKAVVRRSRLLVTTDSGPRHFAAAFGVPAVVLFGPTHVAWSETYAMTETRLQIAVDCGPCMERTCPLEHHRCMRDLRVDMVFDAVRRAL